MQYLRRLIAVVLLAIAASGPALALSPSAFQVLFSGGWWLPGASVDMNFATGQYYGCDISCVSVARASTGYAQTASGTLVNFAANVPRITDQGLLIEEARTNLALQSQTFQTTWTALNVFDTTFSTLTAAPDATNTAQKLTENTTNGNHRINQDFAKAGSALAYSYTIYAKQAERTRIVLWLQDGSGNGTQAAYDLAGGQIGVAPTNTGTGFTGSTASIALVANGFYRLTLNATSNTATGLRAVALLDNGSGTAALSITYIGTNGNGAYIWGAQLEQAAFPTSYIPTTTASAARAADVSQLIGPAATAALAAKAMYAQTNLGEGISTAARLIDFNGTQSASFASTSTVAITNGTNTATATLGSSSYSGAVKSAFGFDATSITARANGGTQATSANAFGTPSGAVYLGNLAAGNRAINAYIARITVSPNKGQFDRLTAP